MIQGVETSTRLRCLRTTLNGWIQLNRRLGRSWSRVRDVPWWYNERALLSLLVGAVWRSGGEAFEEYSEQKRSGKGRRNGCVDLWFSKGPHDFWGEAKQCQIPFTRALDQIERVKIKMRAAKMDVGKCEPDGSTRRLAIVFGAPYLRPCSDTETKQRIAWLIDQARTVEHDALAWVFPTLKRPAGKEWISPGSILWIKEVRRSR